MSRRSAPRLWTPGLAVTGLIALAAVLSAIRLSAILPFGRWWPAVLAPDATDIPELLVNFSVLPRLCVVLLCGAALGLAGALLQQVLRNPLAEPTTLGVAAGAYLVMSLASVWLPGLTFADRQVASLLGGALAALFVLALAARSGLAPATTVLAGLLVTLVCSSVGTTVALLHDQTSASLLLWASGTFDQQGWTTTRLLAFEIGIAACLVLILATPLTVLGLADGTARSLGVSLVTVRLFALAVAVALTGFVVCAVGIVGFVGLAAPAFARITGARRLRDRLIWAPLLGAALLWLADEVAQSIRSGPGGVSTGSLTALLGAPLMIWLVPKLTHGLDTVTEPLARTRFRHPGLALGACVLLLALLACASLFIGRTAHGLTLSTWTEVQPFLFWRAPRMLAALSAGVMLAVAGTLLQRCLANPMAGPELFGISSGAALGLTALVFSISSYTATEQGVAAMLGAIVALAGMMGFAGRAGFAPNQVLLVGMAVTSLSGAVVTVLFGLGDVRAYVVLRWLSGSTDLATPQSAAVAAAGAIGTIGIALVAVRWLAILPLGAAIGQELGLDLNRIRAIVLVLAAVPTALATIFVGPLTFVGLLAPSIAVLLGMTTLSLQILGAAAIGSLIMVAADWMSRIILFPNQFSAGLLASLIGAPFSIYLLRRR